MLGLTMLESKGDGIVEPLACLMFCWWEADKFFSSSKLFPICYYIKRKIKTVFVIVLVALDENCMEALQINQYLHETETILCVYM